MSAGGSEPEIDATRCPLCGEANACGMAAGREECWCFTTALAPEALARIPASARGVACICAKCGSSPAANSRCARG